MEWYGKRCHDNKMGKKERLMDEYRFPGFRPKAEIKGIFGDSKARVVRLVRTQNNRCVVVVAQYIGAITTRRYVGYATCYVERCECIWRWRFGAFSVGDAGR